MLPSQSFRRWLKRRDFTSGHGQRRSSKCQRRCPKAIHSKNQWQAVSVGWIEIILAMEKWLIFSSFSIHFPNYSWLFQVLEVLRRLDMIVDIYCSISCICISCDTTHAYIIYISYDHTFLLHKNINMYLEERGAAIQSRCLRNGA